VSFFEGVLLSINLGLQTEHHNMGENRASTCDS
jgi:hypothetical protein